MNRSSPSRFGLMLNDSDGGGRVFGSDEVNVENWKALTRLVGHTAGEIFSRYSLH